MPIERVHSTDQKIDFVVQWRSDQELHVATVVPTDADGLTDPDPGYLRIIEVVNEWLREAKMQPIDPVKLTEALPHRPHFGGWYAELDRRGVQRAIEVLRRARNQVHGADV